jgi:8-oxo-dGTP pyrophosphatase MutT (NUDIX family)
MILSCGAIVVKDNKILIAKPYKNVYWNIPKGKQNDNESFFDTASRETLEECNVDINKNSLIRELGTFKYLVKKDLHLYLIVLNYEPELKCNSYFFDKSVNEDVPEMVDFKWIEFKDYKKYFSAAMNSVFGAIEPDIKTHIGEKNDN